MIQKNICGMSIKSTEDLYGVLWTDEEAMNRYWKIEPGMVCVDAGYGPGSWTLAALAQGGLVHAFDPKPNLEPDLSRLIAVNGYVGCTIVKAGLWNKTCTELFGINSFKEKKRDKIVPVTTLDDYVNGNGLKRLDIVNLDVEWAEHEVIEGAKDTISRFKPKMIVEVHDGITEKSIQDALSCLVDYKYELYESYVVATP